MFALITAMTILLVATSPPAVTTDSVSYLVGSDSIRRDPYQMRDYDETPLVRFAPLYSVYLAIIDAVSPFDRLTDVSIGNAILYAATLWLAFRQLKRVTRRRDTLVAGMLSAALASPLYTYGSTVCSEPLFYFLALLLIDVAGEPTGFPYRRAVILGIIAAAAALTRYAGVTLIAAGAIFILIAWSDSMWTRFRAATIFGFVAVIPFGGWLARNYLSTGTFSGERVPPTHGLWENLDAMAVTICHWIVPNALLNRVYALEWLLPGAIAAILVFAVMKTPSVRRAPPALLVCGSFAAIYLAGILALSRAADWPKPMSDRFISPVYLPICIFVVGVLDRALGERKVPSPIYALFGIWLLYPMALIGYEVYWNIEGSGGALNSMVWKRDPTIEHLREMSARDVADAYTNRKNVPFWFTGVNPRRLARGEDLASFLRNSPGTVLIWLNWQPPDAIGLKILRSKIALVPVVESERGGIFVSPTTIDLKPNSTAESSAAPPAPESAPIGTGAAAATKPALPSAK
jgi:hypothetical protein